jgi:hypothetical protein
MQPADGEIGDSLGSNSKEANLDFDGIIFAYLEDDLSAEERELVEERLRTDPKFRARTDVVATICSLVPKGDLGGRARAVIGWKKLEARAELEKHGIPLSPLGTRRPHARRTASRPWPAMPLAPEDFVEFLRTELGTDSASDLADYVFDIVEETGKADRWICEVGQARDHGAISPAVAHFLICKFAELATMHSTRDRPSVLSRLSAEIVRLEREHGLEEDEHWTLKDGPPEWQALFDEWRAAFRELVMDMLLRNGQREIADPYAAGDGRLYWLGRALVFGDSEDDDSEAATVDRKSSEREATDAELAAQVRAEVGEEDDDDALMIDFILGEMPEADMDRVADRLRMDPKFRELATWTLLIWTVPLSTPADPALYELASRVTGDDEAKAERTRRKLKARRMLSELGINVSNIRKRPRSLG